MSTLTSQNLTVFPIPLLEMCFGGRVRPDSDGFPRKCIVRNGYFIVSILQATSHRQSARLGIARGRWFDGHSTEVDFVSSAHTKEHWNVW